MAFIAGTRVALGAGISLLLSERFNTDQRKGAGWVLFGIGVLSSMLILIDLVRKPSVDKPLALVS
jgi:hypothetical protein